MDLYLIICDDWRLMEESPETLRLRFEHFLDKEARLWAPVPFAEYSCLTQRVCEEIDLVVSSQAARANARLNYDEFIDFWGWRSTLATKVYCLSGGWRKLLGISLCLNQRCDSFLFVDFASHLANNTIAFALDRMSALCVEDVGFVEYDRELLLRELHSPILLSSLGVRFVEVR